MYLVDTNVVSEFMRPRPAQEVLRWAGHLSRFALSAITVEEIWYGLSVKPNARMEHWFEDFARDYCDVFPVTAAVAHRCGVLRARIRSQGGSRTQADMLIAATAAEHDLVLATRNERDFEGCGIRVVNPFSS